MNNEGVMTVSVQWEVGQIELRKYFVMKKDRAFGQTHYEYINRKFCKIVHLGKNEKNGSQDSNRTVAVAVGNCKSNLSGVGSVI